MIVDLRKVPVLRALFPFAAGIAISDVFPESFDSINIFIIIVFLITIFLTVKLLFRKHDTVLDLLIGPILIVIFILTGILALRISMTRTSCNLDNRNIVIAGRVRDISLEKEKVIVLKIEATQYLLDSSVVKLKENFQVSILKDSVFNEFLPGETWIFGGKAGAIRNRGNPGEFDFRSYMARRNYHYNLFVTSGKNIQQLNRKPGLRYLPARLRQRIIAGWGSNDKDAAVLSALTLGFKSFLDKETKDSFADAGAMHLLAVSGLHVGMIWWVLEILFRIHSGKKSWRRTRVFIIICILWFYAGITGFSDSVTRSVTMFSLVSFSRGIDRNSNIFNTLFLSAFILLLLKPSRIFEPGFQLSYIAVFGIVTIQPLFSLLYAGSGKIASRFFDLISVSMAAQVATLPLVLLYFKQFPLWFLLTNIFAIPLVSVILALFVVFSPFLILFPEFGIFQIILLKIVHILNCIVSIISSLPGAVIQDVPISGLTSAGVFLTMLSLVALATYRRLQFLILSGLMLSLTIAGSTAGRLIDGKRMSMQVFNQSDATVVSFLAKSVRRTYFLSEEKADSYAYQFMKSLNTIPVSVRKQTLINMDPGDPGNKGNSCELAKGIWAIKDMNSSILVAGECSGGDLNTALSLHPWDYIIIGKGFPVWNDETFDTMDSLVIIADGTLRKFEIEALKLKTNNIFFTSEEGCFEAKPGGDGTNIFSSP